MLSDSQKLDITKKRPNKNAYLKVILVGKWKTTLKISSKLLYFLYFKLAMGRTSRL